MGRRLLSILLLAAIALTCLIFLRPDSKSLFSQDSQIVPTATIDPHKTETPATLPTREPTEIEATAFVTVVVTEVTTSTPNPTDTPSPTFTPEPSQTPASVVESQPVDTSPNSTDVNDEPVELVERPSEPEEIAIVDIDPTNNHLDINGWCVTNFGSGAQAKYSNWNDPDSWYCVVAGEWVGDVDIYGAMVKNYPDEYCPVLVEFTAYGWRAGSCD